MAVQWYFQCMGDVLGPFEASELRQRAINGDISHDTLVTRTGTDEWVTADRVKGLLSPTIEASSSQQSDGAGRGDAPKPTVPLQGVGEAQDLSSQLITRWRSLSEAQRRTILCLASAGFVLILAFSASNDRSAPASGRATSSTPYSALPSEASFRHSRPILYPEAGSRDWASGGYDGENVWGYRIPNDPQLRAEYFRDMEAENERLYREAVREGLLQE